MTDALETVVEQVLTAHYAYRVGTNLRPTPGEQDIARRVAQAVARRDAEICAEARGKGHSAAHARNRILAHWGLTKEER